MHPDYNITQIAIRHNLIKTHTKMIEKISSLHSANKLSTPDYKRKMLAELQSIQETFKIIKQFHQNAKENKKEEKDEKEENNIKLRFFIAEHLLHNFLFTPALLYIQKHKININQDFYKNLYKLNNKEAMLAFCKQNKIHLKNIKIENPHYKKDQNKESIIGTELETIIRIEEYLHLSATNKEESIKYLSEHFASNIEAVKQYLPNLIYGNLNILYNTRALFRQAYYKIHKQTNESRLQRRIIYGVVALKTKMCGIESNPMCPTCFNLIHALRLPYCKKENSVILCKGSDVIMNESNQAFMFDSGYVYCEEYIMRMEYNYVCKETGITCKGNPRICYFL